MGLPTNTPPRRRDLIAFDIRVSLPTAVAVLRRRLSPRQIATVLFRYVASAARDPLADVSGEGWPADKEVLVRQQFRTAVRLDDALDALRELDQDQRHAILAEIIAEAGANFIEAHLTMPLPADWLSASPRQRQQFVRDTLGQFANADMDQLYTEDDRSLGFDVCVCRFQQLAHAVGRPHLAPMFCAADSVYFARPDTLVQLRRTATLASGGTRCDFRFDFRSASG